LDRTQVAAMALFEEVPPHEEILGGLLVAGTGGRWALGKRPRRATRRVRRFDFDLRIPGTSRVPIGR
jgi:hypothetical protein